jgi:hypothetical protein
MFNDCSNRGQRKYVNKTVRSFHFTFEKSNICIRAPLYGKVLSALMIVFV